MAIVFWDASALSKRYTLETGADTVDAIFLAIPHSQMLSTTLSYRVSD